MTQYRIDLVTVVPAVATVYVDAKSQEDAIDIAISSCDINDFEIVQLGAIETTDIVIHN